jgi:hypothetical protein
MNIKGIKEGKKERKKKKRKVKNPKAYFMFIHITRMHKVEIEGRK